MASNRKTKSKRKSAGVSLMPLFIIIGIIAAVFTVFIGYRIAVSPQKLFTVGMLALFGGLLFESIRVSENPKMIIPIFIGAYVFSLLIFLPGKNDYPYNLEGHLKVWPYYFMAIYAVGFILFNQEKVTQKLTEGITLLLSVSLIYWLIDLGIGRFRTTFGYLLIGIVFSAFSIFSALGKMKLTKTNRLILSIWSSVIILIFTIDNLIGVFDAANKTASPLLSERLYLSLQYFFLGISAIYILQNYYMIAKLLPSKNSNYKDDFREAVSEHINRYSDRQVLVGHSLFCIVFTALIYGLNYKFEILPRHTMIWLVIFSFPILIGLYDGIGSKFKSKK
ncbi:MAG: hypothetical protein WBA59_05680 [Moheibacter sp.]